MDAYVYMQILPSFFVSFPVSVVYVLSLDSYVNLCILDWQMDGVDLYAAAFC